MNAHARQHGMVLLVSLMLLLILTIVAITAASTATLQEKMAYNSQQQNQAFAAAESGINLWISNFAETQIATNITNHAIADGSNNRMAFTSVSTPNPTNCATVVPSYSLNAGEGAGTPQYACYEITSVAKACADPANASTSNCAPNVSDNQARALHVQGYLNRTIQ